VSGNLILLSWNCLVLSRLQAAAGTVAVLMICRDNHRQQKPTAQQGQGQGQASTKRQLGTTKAKRMLAADQPVIML
jgi:hypothetical protein